MSNAYSYLRRGLSQVLVGPEVAHLLGEPVLFFQRQSRKRVRALQDARRILVIRLDEIGDTVLTSPFLRALRASCPLATITLVVKPAVFNLVERCPYVDQVLSFSWEGPGRLNALRRLWRIWSFARTKLWPRRFDVALSPRWDIDSYGSSYLAYMSGAPWRIGFSEKVAPWKASATPRYDQFFTDVVDERSMKHEVEHNLDMLRALSVTLQAGAVEVWTDETDERYAKQLCRDAHVSENSVLVTLGVGARIASKRWPFDRYIQLAQRLTKRDANVRVAFVGGPDDIALGPVPKEFLDWRGKTTLRQLAAVLKRSPVFIGNDSGPLHMAAAAGSYVISLSCHPQKGSKKQWPWPSRFAPWTSKSVLLQPSVAKPPCTAGCFIDEPHCITDISVDTALQSALAVIESIPGR